MVYWIRCVQYNLNGVRFKTLNISFKINFIQRRGVYKYTQTSEVAKIPEVRVVSNRLV